MHPFSLKRFARSVLLTGCAVGPWLAAVAVNAGEAPLEPSDRKAIQEGLAIWRTPGGRFNSACSSCHSPDGFDLAMYSFDDKTITRRALDHVRPEQAKKIVALIHAVRRKYNIQSPLDPSTARPLQPGGEVLPGATNEERDMAFGKSLERRLPSLMAGRIDSLEAAQKARDEILALDPSELKVGIPMNRLSEDVFHGDEHGSLADWISDLPCAPLPEKKGAWFAIVDAYLSEPSDANFWNMYHAVGSHTHPFTVMPFSDTFCYKKYESLLMAQHAMRKAALDGRSVAAVRLEMSGPGTGEFPNPMWQLGEYAALNEGLDGESQGMPDQVRPTISPSLSFPVQMRQIKTPWMWLGWLQDQGLQRTPGDQSTRNGRYFTLALYTDGGLPLHNCYMITRKQMVQSYLPTALPAGTKQRFIFDFSEFAIHRNPIRYEPKEPAHQELFRTMAGNAFRMSMYLLADTIELTGEVHSRATAEYQLDAIREYLAYSDPTHKAENDALVNRTMRAVMSAKDVGRS